MTARADMFRRIVVAFDGAPSAHDALALAQRLRDPDGGALLPACVVPSRPWHVPGRPQPTRDEEESAAAMLAEAQASLPRGIPVLPRTPAASSPARGLTELAEAEAADLITIGSEHGAAGARIGLTRTAGRLLHGAPCAVAVAPPGLRESDPFRHVGIALDASAEAGAALAAGYAIAAASGSAMTIYAALDDMGRVEGADTATRLAVQQRLDAAADAAPPGVNPRTVLLHGPAAQVIAKASEGFIDLLVTGSRSYGPIQRALLGSVSEELLARATHAVLVVPRQMPASAPAAATAGGAEALPAI